MNYLQKIGNNTPIKEERLELKMKQKLTRKEFKKGNGITLIALVVTIVVLLILAGITINYIFSEGGLFDTAKNSGNTWQNAQNSDINALNDLNGMIGSLVNGTGSGGTTDPDTPTPTEVPVGSVTLSQDAATVYMGESLTLTATVLPENASNNAVTWESSNVAVATVDEVGVVRPVSTGNTTITVTTADGSKTDTCTVTVKVKDTSPLAQFAKAGTFVKDENVDTGKEYKELQDKYGNKVRVPKGFKVVETEEVTVPEGIVIEDSTSTAAIGTEGEEGYKAATTGNQFVWIPVGTVYMDETGTNTKQVQLGRYTFAYEDDIANNIRVGDPIQVQLAFNGETENYFTEENMQEDTDIVRDDWIDEFGTPARIKELSTERPGTVVDGVNDLNATAKDLAGFLTSAKNNGGYYIARFEASYGSGYNEGAGTGASKMFGNAKPLSKLSTANTFNASTVGSLWNNITELNASTVSRNMYAGNKDANNNSVGVESDLMNSYAWDTAIVYIRQMKDEYANFANFKYNTDYGSKNVGSKTERDNTGTNEGDKFCNIYDIVANCREWTTEYCIFSSAAHGYPCVYRGGKYSATYCFPDSRSYSEASERYDTVVFRPLCYVK